MTEGKEHPEEWQLPWQGAFPWTKGQPPEKPRSFADAFRIDQNWANYLGHERRKPYQMNDLDAEAALGCLLALRQGPREYLPLGGMRES